MFNKIGSWFWTLSTNPLPAPSRKVMYPLNEQSQKGMTWIFVFSRGQVFLSIPLQRWNLLWLCPVQGKTQVVFLEWNLWRILEVLFWRRWESWLGIQGGDIGLGGVGWGWVRSQEGSAKGIRSQLNCEVRDALFSDGQKNHIAPSIWVLQSCYLENKPFSRTSIPHQYCFAYAYGGTE